jgi:hypothetical protein
MWALPAAKGDALEAIEYKLLERGVTEKTWDREASYDRCTQRLAWMQDDSRHDFHLQREMNGREKPLLLHLTGFGSRQLTHEIQYRGTAK